MEATAMPMRARMELKTTPSMKDLLQSAAALEGLDLTAFVISSAAEKARTVLIAHSQITHNLDQQLTLARVLSSPAKPTQAMKKLMGLPDFAGAELGLNSGVGASA
jgi:uncharacterized protein (DUF1778 family)